MATPQIGDEFAGYRIEALLGRGGMGVVYRAEQERPHRRVALKLLAPELSADGNFRERFIRESDLAAAIEHPNIIPIYNAGEVDGQLYIAMRYVEGLDLKQLVQREGRIDPARALSFASQVGSALDVAHSRGLVHRDVKPHNMLIASGAGPESTDHVYLTDFGLTKHTSSRSGLTAAGHFVGTVDYVAPEQIEGKSIDPRTDVYSLGCVLFECITGRLPYERDSEISIMYAHISDAPPSVRDFRPDMPAGLDAIFAKALAKSPDERFDTCRDLVAAAREELGIVSGERPQAVPTGGTVVAGAVGAAAGAAAAGEVSPTGKTVTDGPRPGTTTPAGAGAPIAAGPSDPGASGWQGPSAQQGGGWQGGGQTPPPGQGGWQQGPGPSDPTAPQPTDPGWQGTGGGGGWQGGGGPGGPPGGGWGGDQPPGGPGKSNKGLIFGIIGALVLIALAVGAFLFLGGDDEEDTDDTTPVASATPTESPGTSPTVSASASVSPSVAPSVSVTPATGDFPAEGSEKFLYDRIPSDIKPNCTRQVPEFMPSGASVGITCDTTGMGADFVNYYVYPSLPAMNRQYKISLGISGAQPNTGSCPSDIPSEQSYGREQTEELGRLVCYNFEGTGRIEWTNNKLLAYSEAVSLSGMSPALYEFWTNAGPFSLRSG